MQFSLYQSVRFKVLFLLPLLFLSCYSFKGTSIPPNIKTFFVDRFKNNALNAPPTLDQVFMEALKDKVRTESRLLFEDTDPDIEFVGTLVDFRVTSEAPQPGEIASINRLTIIVAIEYIDRRNEENGWKSNFSHFFDFESSQDLNSVQDEAIEVIQNQIMEDIFNKAFTNW